MRISVVTAAVCTALSLAGTASAQSRGGSFQGFGGTTFGSTATAPTFGAGVALPVGDHVQVVGEAGRLTDIKAPILDDLLDPTSFDVGMSAWYAEGGLRFTGSRHSAVRPYVEATAGVARLKPGVTADGWLGAFTNTGLAFFGSTEPLVGAGAGVMFQAGPLALDLGYRYKRILADGAISSAFSLGNDGFDVSQVRVGVGVRF
jgi:outer membrane protein with beta-barrel domain